MENFNNIPFWTNPIKKLQLKMFCVYEKIGSNNNNDVKCVESILME